MISFKQYLNEGVVKYEGGSRVKPIEIEEALKLIEANCGMFLKSPGKGGIIRGVKGGPRAGLGDSHSGAPRVSANTFNYYTLWMDNHPSWEGFPKRSRSFICSETDAIAEGFGRPYMCFPYDSAKIAACPDDDLWTSFENLVQFGVSTLSGFMRITNNGFKILKIETPETYAELVSALKKLTKEKISELRQEEQKNKERGSYVPDLDRLLEEADAKDMYEVFERGLEPKHFEKWSSPAKYTHDGMRELFIEGKMIFMLEELAYADQGDGLLYKAFKKKHGL